MINISEISAVKCWKNLNHRSASTVKEFYRLRGWLKGHQPHRITERAPISTKAKGLSVKAGCIVFAFTLLTSAHALDRWAALSQIESRDNDRAIGAVGEISRYQVRRELWRKFAAPEADWQKPEHALAVAQELMKTRCLEFEKSYHRAPSDFEFYVLWNAPAQIQHPSKAVRKRAERFCNLLTAGPSKQNGRG